MSRDWWGDDEPDEHGGKRPFRPDESRQHRGDFGWSVADVIAVAMLTLLLILVSANLTALLLGC